MQRNVRAIESSPSGLGGIPYIAGQFVPRDTGTLMYTAVPQYLGTVCVHPTVRPFTPDTRSIKGRTSGLGLCRFGSHYHRVWNVSIRSGTSLTERAMIVEVRRGRMQWWKCLVQQSHARTADKSALAMGGADNDDAAQITDNRARCGRRGEGFDTLIRVRAN